MDKWQRRFEKAGGPKAWAQSTLNNRKLSSFGIIEGDAFNIRGPEVMAGTGIRALDIGMAAAVLAPAAVIYYSAGPGKEKKKLPKSFLSSLGTPTPKDTGKKRLTAKEDPLSKFKTKAHGGKIKKYAKGGGVRKAARY